MNNVFGFRDHLISEYASFSRSFSRIAAPDIRDEVEWQYADGRYWPEPLIQINPNYQRKGTVQQLVVDGVLHNACADLFQVGKSEGTPEPLHLYVHQMQALAKGQGKQSYVVTTGTGSGKSLSFFIPVIDRILTAKDQGKTARTRAIVIYPMNALANSQLEELDKFFYGYSAGQQPFTVARYTGQESKAERDAIADNPPDIRLTNFMMLERILTRFDEVDRRVVDHDPRRRFTLTPEEFQLINPNTLTGPVFRGEADAKLAKKLYRSAPVLINDTQPNGNPWGIFFMTMLHMSGDSHLFVDVDGEDLLPLYEAKLIHQFDHRWATYMPDGESRDVTDAEKANTGYEVNPRYWGKEAEAEERLTKRDNDGNVIWRWKRSWLMGWHDVTSAHVLRSAMAAVFPKVGVGHTLPLFMTDHASKLVAALLANFDALVLDFIARVKVGGTHLTYGYLKQFPILPPEHYTDPDLDFIVPRVLELTYTAHDLKPWAQDLGYDGEPFNFDPERRALLRAELDGYAKLYGLTRDELRYILDPASIMGEDYPSETFRVLKKNEEREFGEYRTQRLVLAAWDNFGTGELH